jgi:hypothetical protein
MLCRSSRFLMMPGLDQYAAMAQFPARVPLWCSSSLNRPDSTRASYSAMGPRVLVVSLPVTTNVSDLSFSLRLYVPFATCAYPRWPGSAGRTAKPLCFILALVFSVLARLKLLLPLVHIVRLACVLAGIRLGAVRARVLSPRRASYDVMLAKAEPQGLITLFTAQGLESVIT